jgi:hypothetical protein
MAFAVSVEAFLMHPKLRKLVIKTECTNFMGGVRFGKRKNHPRETTGG